MVKKAGEEGESSCAIGIVTGESLLVMNILIPFENGAEEREVQVGFRPRVIEGVFLIVKWLGFGTSNSFTLKIVEMDGGWVFGEVGVNSL